MGKVAFVANGNQNYIFIRNVFNTNWKTEIVNYITIFKDVHRRPTKKYT